MGKVLNYVVTLLTVGTMVAVTMKLTGQIDYPWWILVIPIVCIAVGSIIVVKKFEKEEK